VSGLQPVAAREGADSQSNTAVILRHRVLP
jgi:hypothetical protein